MTAVRGAILVTVVSLGAYANSLGNGFAYDDNQIVPQNEVVRDMDWERILGGPWWPDARGDWGLYRPVTTAALSLQWAAWGDTPQAFHGVNVTAHTGVSLLVLALLLHFTGVVPALVGSLLFAVHPVHTEAVANVVGQAEILAAGFTLIACLLFIRDGSRVGPLRGLRAVAIAALYVLAVGAKEIAVTLPGLLVLLAWWQSRHDPASRPRPIRSGLFYRLLHDLPVFLLLAAALGAFLTFRLDVLGTVLGAGSTPVFQALDPGERVLTAVSLWPEYARLFLFPLDLVAEYLPAILFPASTVTPEVFAGGILLVVGGVLAWLGRRSAPGVTVGLGWIALALLPVSNLFFQVGVLLAERTLYLPSVGLALAAASATAVLIPRLEGRERPRRLVLTGAVAVLAALSARTVTRNPAWMSTYTVLQTLAEEHPESYLAHRVRAAGLARDGRHDAAAEAYDAALRLVPAHQSLILEAAGFYGRLERWREAEELLRRAVSLDPGRVQPYRHLSSQLLRQGRFREGHATALAGLIQAGTDAELWSLVSESYIARGDLAAAARARRAALAADPERAGDWSRLAEILERAGRQAEAAEARRRAAGVGVEERT